MKTKTPEGTREVTEIETQFKDGAEFDKARKDEAVEPMPPFNPKDYEVVGANDGDYPHVGGTHLRGCAEYHCDGRCKGALDAIAIAIESNR